MDEMPAGPEMDALIAEKIIGIRVEWIHHEAHGKDIKLKETGQVVKIACCERYSADIAAAWEVVEKFKDYDWKLYSHGDGESFVIYKDGTHYEGSGTGAPLAICRAALKAVGK